MNSIWINRLIPVGIFVLIASCISEQVEPKFECPTLQVFIDQLENTQCGATNGSFLLSAAGGEGPYSFETSLGSNTTGSFSEVAAGTYTVLVTDSNDCTQEIDVTVSNEDGIAIDEIVIAGAGCGTSDGSLQIIASGGREPFMFSLDNGSPQSSGIFTDLPIAEYVVTATDASGCETTQSVEVLSGVTYEGSIKNIVETNCAISGCHNGSQAPDLRTLEQIQSSASRIKIRTADGSMPRGRTLTQTQIDLIACWVDDGALDN
ncbi:MAG: hypothetical protein RIF33_06170 [Cyclobacteriaceae bacterium]